MEKALDSPPALNFLTTKTRKGQQRVLQQLLSSDDRRKSFHQGDFFSPGAKILKRMFWIKGYKKTANWVRFLTAV